MMNPFPRKLRHSSVHAPANCTRISAANCALETAAEKVRIRNNLHRRHTKALATDHTDHTHTHKHCIKIEISPRYSLPCLEDTSNFSKTDVPHIHVGPRPPVGGEREFGDVPSLAPQTNVSANTSADCDSLDTNPM